MMLPAWNLSGIVKSLGARAQAVAAVEAVLEPTLACHARKIAPKRQRLLEPAAKQPSAKEHAQALLDWIYANVDLSDGPITHAAILEFYTEMLIELDWTPRPWNPVAHQLRLLTTGSRKTYAWITTTTGAVHRLRVYPIPARVVGAASTPETKCNPAGSRTASKLRRAA
jgi:hypothetical protein